MTIKGSLYQFMGHSSLNSLAQQMYVVYSSTQVLLDFFEAVLHGNWEEADIQREKIIGFVQQARQMQQALAQQEVRDLFAPVLHKEVLRVMQIQTQIANKAQAIANLVMGRQLQLPANLAIEYFPLLNKSIAAVYQSYILVNHLEDISVSNNKAKLLEHLQEMIIELDKLENETDHLQIQGRNVVLGMEQELYAVDVLTLYKMLDWTGELADRAHELGGKLVSILVK